MNCLKHICVILKSWKDQWSQKRIFQSVAILLCIIIVFLVCIPRGGGTKKKYTAVVGQLNSSGCNFPAVFNFGDSNSDTGGLSAAFYRRPYPNGFSFFRKPSGRYCDGRVVIDFIAEKLKLPYVSAYLDSMGTDFRHGANFATGGSTIQKVDTRIFELEGGYSPFSLNIQLAQFEQFKERTLELYNEGSSSYVNRFPRLEDFSEALYTLDIGQNDLDAGFSTMTEMQVRESIPSIIHRFAQAVEKLYQLGARTFWIHNTGPIGCLPYVFTKYSPEPGNRDRIGCVSSLNDIVQEFNSQLKDRVSQLRIQLPDAALTYTDMYTAKYSLISEAKKLGFSNPFGICCGHYGDYRVDCGRKKMVNGTEVSGDPCKNPEHSISWDGIHFSQAANKIIASKIIDGSLSEPPKPIIEACQLRQASPLVNYNRHAARV